VGEGKGRANLQGCSMIFFYPTPVSLSLLNREKRWVGGGGGVPRKKRGGNEGEEEGIGLSFSDFLFSSVRVLFRRGGEGAAGEGEREKGGRKKKPSNIEFLPLAILPTRAHVSFSGRISVKRRGREGEIRRGEKGGGKNQCSTRSFAVPRMKKKGEKRELERKGGGRWGRARLGPRRQSIRCSVWTTRERKKEGGTRKKGERGKKGGRKSG